MRHFGGRRRRTGGPTRIIQSIKNVVEDAPGSVAASTTNPITIVEGEDSVAAGQTTVTDVKIPTGSVIKVINISLGLQNLVNIACFAWVAIMQLHSGQSSISPRIVGGNPLRNQVHFQKMFCVGQNQNVNFHKAFKIPTRFQRVRDGDKWVLVINADQVTTQAAEFVYKYYR